MPIVGQGISIDFASGFLAQILSMNRPDESRQPVRVTSAADVTHQYIPGAIIDAGRLEATINFDPTKTPPFNVTETVTITYRDGSTEAASGFMTAVTTAMPDIEDRMTQDVVIQFTGPVTRTPAT